MIKINSPGVFSGDLIDYDSTHSLNKKIDELVAQNSYATCSTTADTVAKEATITNYTLRTGVQIVVKFTNGNSAANPTLNISNTGAKALYANGEPVELDTIKPNGTFLISYDGNNYEIIGGVGGEEMFIGTIDEWDALTATERAEYGGKVVVLTDDGAGAGSGHIILNSSGTQMNAERKLQFTGNVTVNDDSANNKTVVNITDSGHTIMDSEGEPLTQRNTLQFVGDGVTITDDSENGRTIVSMEGGGTTIVQKPTVTIDTYEYNGTAQGPTITGLDTSNTVVTNATMINAGTYTLTIALKNTAKMVWSDLTTADLIFSYTIDKATPTITATPSSITFDAEHTSAQTLSISTTSDATPTLSGYDTDIITVTGSTSPYSITPTQASGTTTITISVAETLNCEAASEIVTVKAAFISIYGVEWDGSSTTIWNRTDDSANFVNPSPAVNNGSGSSPFDNLMPWAGMERVEDSTVGTLVKIPKYYYKWTRNGSAMKLQIADGPAEGFLVSPAHADRGDGVGERDIVYVGAYHCATSTYKSTTGVKPANNYTRSQFRTSIHNLGDNIWQYDYAMLWTIQMLYLVEFADWNSQKTIGYGCGNNSAAENAGLCDAMSYHTGTNASSRTTYGHTRYRWIEDLWGNVYDWCDGIYFSSANVYCIKNPANFSDTSGGTKVSTRPTSSNFISAWSTPTASGFEYALYPSTVSGSESTYISDYCGYNSSGIVLFVGGYYYQSQDRGLFCLYGVAASVKGGSIGSRLQKLP